MPIRSISPAEVNARIQRGERVDLIDVRSGMEWNGGHAVGAKHAQLGSLDPAKLMAERVGTGDDPVYLICASGARSASACAAFHQAGFTQAINVSGGTSAWAAAGLPIERNLKAASLGVVKQGAILALVAGAVLFLMPCSPFPIWGSAYCPTTPSAAAGAGAGAAPAESLDFARDVVAASATTPVLVDFHATWCGPCKMLAPEIDALAAERGEHLRVVRIDVDQQSKIAQEHGVSSIPDLRLWQGGKEIAQLGGFRAKAQIAAWIDAAVKPD